MVIMLLFLLLPQLYLCSLPSHYLSPSGSNSWDGLSPSHSPGTTSGPWLSLPHAIVEIRKLRPSHPGPEDRTSLLLLPGTFTLQQTLELDARDAFLNIAAFSDDGAVVISGGQVLEEAWSSEGRVRTATFPGTCAEVYLDTWRLLPARSPNTAWAPNLSVAKGPWHSITGLLEETPSCSRAATGFSQSCPDSDRDGFVLSGELEEDWQNLDQVEVVVYHSWIAEYARVANVTRVGGRQEVRFQEPLKHAPVGNFITSGGWRFIVINNRAVLDQEGEVVCVQNGEDVTLSYIPPVGLEEEAPVLAVLGTLLTITKSTSISLTGLQFQHTSSEARDGYNYGSQTAVKLYMVEQVNIQKCEFSHLGMIGLYIEGSSRVQVQNSLFWDIGYHGVMIRVDQQETEHNTDILVENNVFTGCGASRYWQPGALWVEGEMNMTVSHNEITNVPYFGIRVTGPMKHGAGYTGPPVFNIEYNHIHDYGGDILSDFGAVYITASHFNCDMASQEELAEHCYTHALVYNNWMENSVAFANGAGYLYSDVSASGTVFENNILRGEGANALYHHCGLDNESRNNIVHRTGASSFSSVWAGCEASHGSLQSYKNYHNIYLFDTLEGMAMYRKWDRYYNQAPVFQDNLYWSLEPESEASPIFPEGQSWGQWREGGNDTGSLWQDPLFRAQGSGDYTLEPLSPAWILGIHQINTSYIGPQESLRKR